MSYTVVENTDYKKFLEDVNKLLADGYTLQGGVCVYANLSVGACYCQALIKA